MANVFFDIPVPTANGPGVAVDVSSMGKTKSFVCGGNFRATVNLEYSTNAPGDNQWAPLATFHQSGNLTIDLACLYIRAVVSDYVSGAANIDVGSNDAGTLFVPLLADGTPADVSLLAAFKTVCVNANWTGTVEASEDGITWAQIMSFQAGTARGQSREFVAQYCRIVPLTVLLPVIICGADNGGGGGGGGGGAFFREIQVLSTDAVLPTLYANLTPYVQLAQLAGNHVIGGFSTGTFAGNIELVVLYAMSTANAGNVELTFSHSEISDGDDPAAALTVAAPFVFTPGNDTDQHRLDSAVAAVLQLAVLANQNINVMLQRSIGGLDTHTGDLRILRMYARQV